MINSVVLMGRLTADPELKSTQSGVKVCSFTLAVERDFRDKSGERKTDFIRCVAWRETAEFVCKHFQKGYMLAFRGEIQTRETEDNHGNKKFFTDILVQSVSFTGEKREKNSPKAGPSALTENSDFSAVDEEDLPF
jgi:single-strand DNA-binding protein